MTKLAACGRAAFALGAAVLGFGGCASAQTTLESSFASARAELARAMQAHGGVERIEKLRAARLELEGQISTGIQGRSPEAIGRSEAEGDFATRVTIDLATGRSRTSGESHTNGGFAFPFTVIYSDGAIKTLTDYPPQLQRQPVGDADEGREQTAGIGTRLATPVLLKVAAQRLATLRHEGTATVDGRRVTRISFNADKNIRLTLAIDAESHRVTGLEQLAADPLLGVDTTRWTFTGTQTVDSFVLPQRASVVRRGIRILDIRLARAQFDEAARIVDADFTPDPKYPPFEPPALDVQEVRPGLWEVANAGQGNYRVQFVELADRLIAYDAPVSAVQSRAVVRKLREKVPAKPITHVVLSHFHNDHIGGARAFAELGATLVTTADAQPVVRRIAEAQAPLAGVIDPAVPALEFVLVDGRLELGDQTRRVTVLEARDGPHVNRLLVLADGGARAVMAADAYSDAMPFNANFDWFVQWLRGALPDAELMLGAHHAPAEVRAILERQAQFRATSRKQASR